EHESDEHELNPIKEILQYPHAREVLRKSPHARRPAKPEECPIDDYGEQKIPENQPIAAFEVGIAAGACGGGNQRKIGIGGRFSTKAIRWLGFRRNGDN